MTAAAVYDLLAPIYDIMYQRPECLEENRRVQEIFEEILPESQPRTLDIGSGTGLLLDLGVTVPERYSAVDPSAAMRHEFIKKHGLPHRYYRMGLEEWIADADDLTISYDLVTALFGAASYLENDGLRYAFDRGGTAVVLMSYVEGYLPAYYTAAWGEHRMTPPQALYTAPSRVYGVAREFGAERIRIGNYDTWVLVK